MKCLRVIIRRLTSRVSEDIDVNVNRESVDHSQDLNWSHKIQGFMTPSDTYTSNKKNLKVDVNRFGDDGNKG
jgi:hypothetical protein